MKVLVVGYGLIGKRRADAVARIGSDFGVELAGTVDPLARDGTLYGGAPHYASLDEVEPSRFDAAILALPHDVAPAIARRLLGEGKLLLVEKPLGRTSEEARPLVEAAKKLALPSFVGFNYRFLPHVEPALGRAKNGALGTLRSVDLLVGHGGHPRSHESWKLDRERAGGGVLIDPGIHLLDLALELDSELKLVSVAATRGFFATGVEEDAVAVLSHARLLVTLRVSHVRWVNAFRLEIFGEDGYAIAEGRGGNYGALGFRAGKRWAWADASGRSQRESEEMLDFGSHDPSFERELAAVLAHWTGRPATDEPSPATFEDGLRAAELCDELYRRLQ